MPSLAVLCNDDGVFTVSLLILLAHVLPAAMKFEL
jgi:hypothetical protein